MKLLHLGPWRLPRVDRMHLSRPDPTRDVGPCDCPIGVDHDGPAVLRGGEQP